MSIRQWLFDELPLPVLRVLAWPAAAAFLLGGCGILIGYMLYHWLRWKPEDVRLGKRDPVVVDVEG